MRILTVRDIFDELSHILARFVSRRMSLSMIYSKFFDITNKKWNTLRNLRITLSTLMGKGCRYSGYIKYIVLKFKGERVYLKYKNSAKYNNLKASTP